MSSGAWVLGTAVGVAGGSVTPFEPVADALFPVLFVGLAGLMSTRPGATLRALAGGLLTLALLLVWPAAGGIGAVVAAIAVCVVIRR